MTSLKHQDRAAGMLWDTTDSNNSSRRSSCGSSHPRRGPPYVYLLHSRLSPHGRRTQPSLSVLECSVLTSALNLGWEPAGHMMGQRSAKINSHFYGQLIFDKSAKASWWEKNCLFNKTCWNNIHMQINDHRSLPQPYKKKTNSHWISDLNVWTETTELLGGKKMRPLIPWAGQRSLRYNPQNINH